MEVRVKLPLGGEKVVSLSGDCAPVREALVAAGVDLFHVGAVVRSLRILSMDDEVRHGELIIVLPPLDGG
ncbi:MAG: hypothetical protein N2315_08385 [Thermanaerothrix sp.]|nr:hypothetical protein [Thermanaerothrix sp.]